MLLDPLWWIVTVFAAMFLLVQCDDCMKPAVGVGESSCWQVVGLRLKIFWNVGFLGHPIKLLNLVFAPIISSNSQ